MKRTVKCRYYGRYVDDAAVVCADREWLFGIVPTIRNFLLTELGLDLHMGKLEISEVHHGVEFLGAFIKPYRTYLSNHALERIKKKIRDFDFSKPWRVLRSVNSYLGIFRHTASYSITRGIFLTKELLRIGVFTRDMTRCIDRYLLYRTLNLKDYEQSLWN